MARNAAPIADLLKQDSGSFPSPLFGVGNLDRALAEGPAGPQGFGGREARLLAKVERAVLRAEIDLPTLPAANRQLLASCQDPDADLGQVVARVTRDAALTAILLKVANSVQFGGARRVDTVRGAVVQIGLKGLRSVLYAHCIKCLVFRSERLKPHAEEIWRQAVSAADAAKCLAVPLCLDPERSYVLGLLHDLGKIPLLEILRRAAPPFMKLSPRLVGFALHQSHERVGEALARSWELPDELVAVAGDHHRDDGTGPYPESVALVGLAHRLDMQLSAGDKDGFYGMVEDAGFERLGLAREHRPALLELVKHTYIESRSRALFA